MFLSGRGRVLSAEEGEADKGRMRRHTTEFHGRQIVFFFTYFGLAAFSAGAAGAQNIETLLVLRFFAGAFGASPLTNSGGVIADMFSAKGRFVISHFGLLSCHLEL